MELILMPQLGISEESALLTQWHVKQGDIVKQGDKLFSIETGKSSFDVDSEHTGTVLALLAAEGDEVTVKAPVCAIGQEGEPVPDNAGSTVAAQTIDEKPAQTCAPAAPFVPEVSRDGATGVSPRAKKLAEKLGVNPALATPTGPEGRVIERDVRAVYDSGAARKPAAPSVPYQDKPLTHMRKIIAKNMMQSLHNTAQLTHTASLDASKLLAARKRYKDDAKMSGVTLGDMVLYAVTRTLPDFPALNAWLLDETLRVFSDVNLAVAVDTERGLMVPVIFAASGLTLPEISEQVKTLAEQCKNGAIPPDSLTGGSFTVSNLGQFGIESFTPILNAPQTGILGVNTITQRVKVVDGCIGAYPCMTLSLTYDHRAIDGAPASRFLRALCKALEDFECTT